MINGKEIPPVGAKVELTLTDIFGKPYLASGKIGKEPYQHGYNLKSGAWALFGGREGDTPCYKFGFIPKRKRQMVVLRLKDVVNIENIGGGDDGR